MTTTSASPTVSELLNAANWEYQQTGLPADLTPFMVDGRQLSLSSGEGGISSHVWETPQHQLVISYQGTQAISLTAVVLDPAFSFRQIVEDTGVAQGNVTTGERDAASFATYVTSVAAGRGIAADDIFVTGHSLGAIQAEYVAQQTGLGGIGFESTGLSRSATTAGDGRNFVNVVQYGDPVANYGTDIAAEQPFAPDYAPGSSGALPHYGYVAKIGDPFAQPALTAAAALSQLGPVGVALTTVLYGVGLAAYHVPNVQAYSLGVTLTQYGASEVSGIRSGPVLAAADATIADLIAATHATYAAPSAPDPNVSADHGASAGGAAALLASGADFAQVTHLDDAAALLNRLILPAGGIGADPGEVTSILSQIFMPTESAIAGLLSRTLDTLARSASGLDGDNLVVGRSAGADIILRPGAASVYAFGLGGDDTLSFGSGDNYLSGGAGRDTIVAGGGNNHIWGNASTATQGSADGADTITVGGGTNYINGNAGDDVITVGTLGSTGANRVNGGADDDRIIFYGAGANYGNGNSGADSLDASAATGNNLLRGGQGDDVLRAGFGQDQLLGDLGNDILIAGAGGRHLTVMTGGEGADLFDFSRGPQGSVTLSGATYYQDVTDFARTSDHIGLAFAVSADDVLTASAGFEDVGAARAYAQQALAGHGATGVAALQVGADTYLFYDATGLSTAIDSVVKLDHVASAMLTSSDFVVA